MKRIIFLILLTPCTLVAQEKLSNAYLGAILHDFDHPGLSLVNSFGISPYLGIGAGVDLTSYKSSIMVPVYADIRIKYPVKDFTPFILGQVGKHLYNNKEDDGINWTDVTGAPVSDENQKIHGKYFYGGGVGVAYRKNKVGFYLTYTQRHYYFSGKDFEVNGRTVRPEYDKSLGLLTAGLVF